MNIKALLRALESTPAHSAARVKATNDIIEFNSGLHNLSRRDVRSAVKADVSELTNENPFGVSLDPEPREIRRLAGGFTEPTYHSTRKDDLPAFDPKRMDFGIHGDPDPLVGLERVRTLDSWDLPLDPTKGNYTKNRFADILAAIDDMPNPDYATQLRERLLGSSANTIPLLSRVPHDTELKDMGYWAATGNWVHDTPRGLPKNVADALQALSLKGSPVDDLELVRDTLRQHDIRGIKYVNDIEGEGGHSTLNLVPSDVRSRMATFDPRSWTSSQLMRSVPPATLALLLTTLGGEGSEEEA